MEQHHNQSKRVFLKNSLIITGSAFINFLPGCKEGESEEDVSPAEDLMREHGLLNRILLIYDTAQTHLLNNNSFSIESLSNAATIVQNFIEDYHEKLEENYLFPRFEKANQLVDLVQVLRAQHEAGRNVTNHILQLTKSQSLTNDDQQQLVHLLAAFNKMYRPHEAREDTVLFPALKKIVSKNEYDSLGEDFEKKEHQLFGEDGFDSMVEKVANLEKQLNIYELDQFTPKF